MEAKTSIRLNIEVTNGRFRGEGTAVTATKCRPNPREDSKPIIVRCHLARRVDDHTCMLVVDEYTVGDESLPGTA